MRVLLTGATGFIGAHVLKELVQDGHQVVGYDQVLEETSIQEILTPEEISQATLIRGDVTDLSQVLHICQNYSVDTIVHQAGLLAASEANPPAAVRINVLGTLNMFEAARILKLKRVVWASSQTVFGGPENHPEGAVSNDAPHYPWSVYSASKSYLEYMGKHYFDHFGVDNIALRYCLVYGIGRQARHGSYPVELIDKPAYGFKGTVENGDDVPNWVYAKDAARATVLACTAVPTRSRAFTITGEEMAITELRDYVLSLLPDAEIELLPGRYPTAWHYDTQAAEQELGYRPQYSAKEGAFEIIECIRRKRGLPSLRQMAGQHA